MYLDAVLHPAIYRKRAIFEQEGWHYELGGDTEAEAGDSVAGDAVAATEAADGSARLVLNGVVYNEMKGALSDPEFGAVRRAVRRRCSPTRPTASSRAARRAPSPTLTYEQFLEDAPPPLPPGQQLPSRLYGDLDLDGMLAFLDERYLSPVADEQAASDGHRLRGRASRTPTSCASRRP